MNSLHWQQPEDHLHHRDARTSVLKIKEIAKKAQSCFFCTGGVAGTSQGARPMNVRQVDDDGNLWFLSASDSRKNEELAFDPAVTLFFQSSPHSDFLHLVGRATISRDRAKIEELWEPVVRTWFPDGIDDPRITVIKVTPTEGYYWDIGHAAAAAGLDMPLRAAPRRRAEDAVLV
jgi:general stress protein 26